MPSPATTLSRLLSAWISATAASDYHATVKETEYRLTDETGPESMCSRDNAARSETSAAAPGDPGGTTGVVGASCRIPPSKLSAATQASAPNSVDETYDTNTSRDNAVARAVELGT